MKNESPLLVADHHIWQVIAVEITCYDLCADTAIEVDHLRNEFHTCSAALQLEPIEQRGVMISLVIAAVRPESCSCDKIFQAIAIHIDEIHGVQIADHEGVWILRGSGTKDGVLAELDRALIQVTAKTLEPCQAITMGVIGSDHIRVAVAIDIVDIHLRPAASSEGVRDELPFGITFQGRWLLPPTLLQQ